MLKYLSGSEKGIHTPSKAPQLFTTALALAIFLYLLRNMASFLLVHATSSVKVYGYFYLSLKTLQTLATIFLMGSALSAVHFIPNYLSPKKEARLKNYIRWNYRYLAKSFALYYVLLTVFHVLAHFFGWLNTSNQLKMIVYVLYFVPFLSLVTLWSSFLKSIEHRWVGFISGEVFQFGSIVLVVFIGTTLLDRKLTYTDAEHLLVVSVLAACLFCFMLRFRLGRRVPGLIKSWRVKHVKCEKLWPKYSKLYFMTGSIYFLAELASFYVVVFFASSKNTIGLFAFIVSLTSIFYLVSTSTSVNLNNRVSSLYRKKQISCLKLEVKNTNVVILSIQCFLLGGLAIFMPYIGTIYGAEYGVKEVYISLLLLIVGFFLESFSATSYSLLTYGGFQKQTSKINLFHLIFTIVFGIPAVIHYGLIGICSVIATKKLVGAVLMQYLTKKHMGFNPLIFRKPQ